jgi:aminopeptidase YwaD
MPGVVKVSLINEVPDVSVGDTFQSLRLICGIGNRWPGTPGEERVIEFLHDNMKPLVDKVELEEFSYPRYTPLASALHVWSPVKMNIPCVPVEYSKNGHVEGQLVYVGAGWEKDFDEMRAAGIDFLGKIVVSRTDRPYIVRKGVEKHGAAGMVIVSDSPFRTIRQITSQMGYAKGEDLKKFGAQVPGVVVDRESGERLLSLCSAGSVDARIDHRSKVELRSSYNVIGITQGDGAPDEQVIVGAHYDTQLGIEGAWDNGSGCAALLEICRICARSKSRRTMVFCGFGGEEIGLFGSTSFVRKREGSLNNVVCYVNLDSTSGDVCYTHVLHFTKNMRDFSIQVIGKHSDWRITESFEFTDLDHEQDSAEFVVCGVPAIWAHEEGNAFFHTKYDTIKTIDPVKLSVATRASLLPFYYLANAHPLPIEKRGAG